MAYLQLEEIRRQLIAELGSEHNAEKAARIAADQRMVIELKTAGAAQEQQDAAGGPPDNDEAVKLEVGVPETALEQGEGGDTLTLSVDVVRSDGEGAGLPVERRNHRPRRLGVCLVAFWRKSQLRATTVAVALFKTNKFAPRAECLTKHLTIAHYPSK